MWFMWHAYVAKFIKIIWYHMHVSMKVSGGCVGMGNIRKYYFSRAGASPLNGNFRQNTIVIIFLTLIITNTHQFNQHAENRQFTFHSSWTLYFICHLVNTSLSFVSIRLETTRANYPCTNPKWAWPKVTLGNSPVEYAHCHIRTPVHGKRLVPVVIHFRKSLFKRCVSSTFDEPDACDIRSNYPLIPPLGIESSVAHHFIQNNAIIRFLMSFWHYTCM